jgi:hypothetical protein
MDETQWNDQIGVLEGYFGKDIRGSKKNPGAGRQYWEELRGLPGDAFTEICRACMKQHPPVPSHFPTIQQILDDWQGWLKSHPDRQARVQWEFCRYCEPDAPGTIEVAIPLEKAIYRDPDHNYRHTVVRCGHCRNDENRNPTWPRLTVDQIRARGWTVITKEHQAQEEEDPWRKTPRPSPDRSPGMKSIQDSLPAGDIDEQIPF